MAEAIAWTRKYLIAASFSWFIIDWRSNGINEYRFNSNPIQDDSQLFDVREKKIPIISIKENRNVKGLEKKKFIKIGKGLNLSCIGLEDHTI